MNVDPSEYQVPVDFLPEGVIMVKTKGCTWKPGDGGILVGPELTLRMICDVLGFKNSCATGRVYLHGGNLRKLAEGALR